MCSTQDWITEAGALRAGTSWAVSVRLLLQCLMLQPDSQARQSGRQDGYEVGDALQTGAPKAEVHSTQTRRNPPASLNTFEPPILMIRVTWRRNWNQSLWNSIPTILRCRPSWRRRTEAVFGCFPSQPAELHCRTCVTYNSTWHPHRPSQHTREGCCLTFPFQSWCKWSLQLYPQRSGGKESLETKFQLTLDTVVCPFLWFHFL